MSNDLSRVELKGAYEKASPRSLRSDVPSSGNGGVWSGDCGDGTYRNPVLFADYSDADAIRVGEDFWLTASSFSHVPGLPILHSRDLVNWTLVNHALSALVPVDHFSRPRHGEGVWAPAIRHQHGKFWIFYPDPDFGIYVVTADDPRETWSAPIMVKSGQGLIDPCPFWDDDGAVYLIHGWAKSRAGISNRLTLHRMNDEGTAVTDAGQVIVDGDQMDGWHTLEGPKLYKRSGVYYIFAPAGGVKEGYQAVFRARHLHGPYENRIVLAQGVTPINGPHQGAWIDTPAGEHWFLHFQERPAYGRVVHLQPMQWSDDGWPIIGEGTEGGSVGSPLLHYRKPAQLVSEVTAPAAADEFDSPELGRQWQWQANPQPGWASLNARPGALRLACVGLESPTDTLWAAAHLLMQKFPGPTFVATTQLALTAVAEGDAAGLIVFGLSYAWIGLRREAGNVQLVLRQCHDAHTGGTEQVVATVPAEADSVLLRVSVSGEARCQFAYAFAANDFSPLGRPFQAVSSFWVGAKMGVFAAAATGRGPKGHADFSWFRVGEV